ncbi:lipocalin family protein [Pedobacter punctiformis]|uniref:Lipocalin family protein n=1 Tax=Pedobacter punctiformis TaxID=3004097 RepID=A0ABT4LA15_9SPHI|nr:lipocalin family protein [Pedobacter sp. HCMS5-2]MCZ4244532.1 lipocalin family protein [Pedobacter sp. HCMS5-2]
MENKPVDMHVDVLSYAGRWYCLYSIPRFINSHWKHTIETYVIHPDGYYAVFTTYNVVGEKQKKYMRSKLSVVPKSGNSRLKAQFVWPVKIDYWIIELAEGYSYAVVGHPKHKYLIIMARKPEMDASLLNEIIERSKQRGYDTNKLVSLEH